MPRHTFVLIAGAWHGAWCWQEIAPLLEALGHRVLTPELPATGADTTDASHVTLDGWAQFVLDAFSSEPEPVTLVGHSRGGIVISRAAELAPDRIRRLVYVAGYLLTAGQTLADAARSDSGSLVPPNMVPAAGGVSCRLRDEVVRDAFYGNTSDTVFEYARARLSPEPLKPLVTPLRITHDNFGRVPRAYVECLRDLAVTIGAQRRMQAALPCDPVFTLDSDHSPFLSQPAQLAKVLDGL